MGAPRLTLADLVVSDFQNLLNPNKKDPITGVLNNQNLRISQADASLPDHLNRYEILLLGQRQDRDPGRNLLADRLERLGRLRIWPGDHNRLARVAAFANLCIHGIEPR